MELVCRVAAYLNKGMELTASSVRSCLAPASGISSCLALGFRRSLVSSIKAIEVRLAVADVPRSADFYANTLGFEVGTLWPDNSPQFAILRQDNVRLQLSRSEDNAVSA